jgi:hypothetical protein
MFLTNKKSIIKYCKKHPNEIVCFLNKHTKKDKEIFNRYLELNVPFVVLKEYSTILEKYKLDKIRIDDPCYIGTSEAILAYHKGKLKNIMYKNIFNQTPNVTNVSFLPEIILFTFFSLLLFLKRSVSYIVFCIFLFLIFLEYELEIKHLDIPLVNKVTYLLIDGLHIFLVFLVIYLLILFKITLFKFRIKYLTLLNILCLNFVFFFFIYEQCILSIINNNITNRFTIWKGTYNRLYYFFNLNHPYVDQKIYTKKEIHDIWISGNKYFVLILFYQD